MSRISLAREHNLKPAALRKRAEQMVRHLQDEYGGEFHWDGNNVHYSYSGGLDATLTLRADDILVDVKLGMMMRLMKDRIERGINKQLDHYLA